MTPGKEFLRGLVCGYESEIRRIHPIVVLKGFADDSGSSENANVFILAGYISPAPQWEDFSDEWEYICNKNPKTPNFKMHKAWRLRGDPAKGQYRWTEEQRDQRIADLSAVVADHASYRVHAIVRWIDYKRVLRGIVRSEIDNPYYVLFYNVILNVAKYMDDAGIDGSVDWVFDEQGPIGIEARDWYYRIRDRVSPEVRARLGKEPQFANDDKVLPLKAADMLAWHLHREFDQEQIHPIRYNQSDNCNLPILQSVPGAELVINDDDLRLHASAENGGPFLQAHGHFFLPSPETGIAVKTAALWRYFLKKIRRLAIKLCRATAASAII